MSINGIDEGGAVGGRPGPSEPSQGVWAAVPWGAVLIFTFIAYALAWLVMLPVHLGRVALDSWITQGLVMGTMLTPAMATLVVVFVLKVPPHGRSRFLGLWPLRPVKRVVGLSVVAVFFGPLLMSLVLFLAAAFGLVSLDLSHHSLLEQTQRAATPAGVDATLPPLDVLFWLTIIALPVNSILVSILAFGEEVGWRGWLVPALRPLGTWPTLLISGVIWGLWHAPVTLLGHNFGLTNWRGVAMMVASCVSMGMVIGWFRLRSGSVWPAVFAHGSINAGANVLVIFGDATAPPNTMIVGPGVVTWVVCLVIVAVLVATKQFSIDPQLGS